MCGIFGYVGSQNNAAAAVLAGLKLLEYRGYDSWGIAVKKDKKLVVDKHVGKIGNATTSLPKSVLGIGHTRWATHGGVTVKNAHPHLDCNQELAVVHNGIVENYTELKAELLKKGHTFVSETDTEVISHLIEEYLKKEGFASAVRDTFNRLNGLNAIVVAYAPSQEVIAAKTGSPLVVGMNDDGYYVASDASGIIKHTNKMIFLEDNQMVILGKKIQLIKLPGGTVLKAAFQKVDWKFEESVKGKYDHYFLKEMYEEPQVIKNIALNYDSETRKFANLVDNAFGTFMLACGTASHAAMVATYLFSNKAKKHVNFAIGSEFNYLEDYITKGTLVIPISQSGESVDVIQPVVSAQKKGATIAAIVNVLGSTLYRQADHSILLNCGVEKCVVATKSFIAMISLVLLITYTLAKRQHEGKNLLLDAAKDVEKILRKDSIKEIKRIANILAHSSHVYVIGRGASYPIALEVALKIKESSYVHAEGFAGGELKHGVIALIEKGSPCIVLAPNDETYSDIISNAQEIKARGGYIIGIGPINNSVFDEFLETADLQDATMIPQVVTAQLLAYNLALKRGVADPDKPRNLAKSVTVK